MFWMNFEQVIGQVGSFETKKKEFISCRFEVWAFPLLNLKVELNTEELANGKYFSPNK